MKFTARMIVRTVLVGLLACGAAGAQESRPAKPTALESGKAAMRAKEFDKALAWLDRAMKDDDKASDEAAYLKALSLYYAGKHAGAVEAADVVLAKFPNSSWRQKAVFVKAAALAGQRKFQEAEAIYADQANRLLSGARKQKIASVVLEFADALAAKPDPKDVGAPPANPARAANLYRKVLTMEIDRALKDEVMFKAARADQDAGNFAQAIEDYRAYLIEFDPTWLGDVGTPARMSGQKRANPPAAGKRPLEARHGLAECQLRSGDNRSARTNAEDWLVMVAANSRQHPLTADARWLVVKTYALPNPSGEELEQAVKSAREFPQRAPADPRTVVAAWWIAQAYQAHGRADQAVAAYEDFIEGKSHLMAEGDGPWEKIEEFGKSQIVLEDEWRRMALYCIGQIRFDQRKYEEAMKAWQSYTQKYPNGPQWAACYQGIIEAEYGAAVGALADKKHEEARKLFEDFLAKHPLDERARQILFTFGQVDYADAQKEEDKGEKANKVTAAASYKRAIDQWQRLTSQHRGSEEASLALYRIGQIYEEKLGNLDKALETYRELTWGSYAGSARARIAMMTQKSLTVRTDRKFRTNEPAKIRLNVRNIEKLTFKQYNLDLEAYFRKTHTIGSVDALDIDLIQPDKTWEVKIDGYTKYKPIEQTVEVPFADGKAGVCIVNVSEEDLEGTTLVLRSDLDMIVKSSRKEALVFVQNMRTETPAADVDLLLSDGQKVFGRGKTGKDGVYRAVLDELKSVEKLRVFAWSGGSVASDGLELSGLGLARGVSARGYIYTDRSAYQPGQTVKFRGIIRDAKDGGYACPAGESYLVTVADSQGRQLSQKTLALSAFGTFNAELTLDVQAPVGAYTITAAAKDKPEKSYSSQFLVQQFKTEKMRLTLQTDRAVYFRGESVKLSIAADYYWGQPVAGKSVRYSLPDGRQLTATTDAAGKIAVTFDTTGLQPGAPLRFAAELEGENVRAAHVAVLARLGLTLAVKPARDLVLSEESVDVEVAATMPDGKPAGDQAVKLFVLQRQAAAPDPVFAGLPWLARPAPQSAEATVEEHALTTDKETGKAVVKLSLKKGGQYVLRATAEDRFKQVVTGQSAVSVSDDEDATKLRFFADSDTLQVGGKAVVKLHSRVEAKLALLTFEGETILSHKVVAIKKDYNSIDVTVGHEHFPNFQIAVAVMDGRALRTAAKPFTVQRQLNVKVRPLQEAYAPGAAGKAELTVTDQLGKPVKGELSLAVVDEAVFAAFPDGTPKILDFFQAGAKRQAEFRLASTCGFAYAAPTRKVLQAYKDEKERLAQQVEEAEKLAELAKDQSGSGSFARPVLAPAMPVVVTGRMNAAAKAPAARRVAAAKQSKDGWKEDDEYQTEPPEDLLASGEGGEGLADKKVRIAGGKGGGPGEIAAPARREMPGAGLWLPAVVTDADGKAVVELPMPETTTRWRLTARGCTVETLVGEAAGGVVTRKDFFVAVKAPASWQEGDKVRLLARIHNMTKYTGPVEVTLTIWGGEGFKNRLVEKADTVKIDADGTAELLLPEVDVPLAAGLKVEVSARAGKAADALAIEVPIRPWGLEFAADAGGVSKDSAVVEVQLPAGRKYGSTWMSVSIGADLQRTVLDLAAGGGYPVPLARGCVILPPPEEAAHPGSELLAAAAGLRYAKALKAPAPDIQRLADRAGGLIATLVVSQQADGGWCWRGRAGADWAVTATCFWALVEARGEGVPVNAQTIASAREYLRNTFTRLGTGENDPKAAILHALSTDNAADFAHANRLHRERNALSGPALAYTAMACVNLKRPELAKELLDVLEQKGHKAPDAANGLQWDGAAAYSYLNDDIETTALAALAMMKARPGSPKIKDAVDFLLARRGCGGFSPAKARGPAVSAIAEYFRAGADAQADYRLAVLVNGKELKTIEARGGQETLLLAVPGESIVEGKNRVEFRLTGRGQFAYAVTLRGFSTDMAEPGGWNYPRAQLRTCRHANLEYRGRPIPAGSSSPVSNVEVGQHVKVNVNMEHWDGQNAYVAVEEPLPAGMVLVEGSLQGRFIHHDVRDGRIMMYFPPGGSIGNYAYELVGYSTGQYRVGPTVIRDLLHPGRMRVAGATALAVLRPGEKSDDKYEMNREERFALGQLYFNDGLYKEALTHLEPLLDRKQPYNEREVARMLLWIYTAEGFYDARRIVDVFEVLRERYTDLEIPFEKILTIGKAYHDIGEFERAYLVFRATIDASFVKDANVSAVLEEEGQFLGSLDYQEDLWREYPDTAEVAQAYFALSQVLYQKAPEAAQLAKQAIRNAKAKGRAAPGRLPNRVDMLKEAIGLLKEFMTLYPTNPLADDAAFSMANAYLDLKQYEAVVELCTGFTTLFPKSEFEGGFQYMAALGHFWQRRSEQALAAAKVVAEGQSKDRDFARYIVAQIYHAEGKPAEAIDWYRKVAEQYPDAKGAVDYFEAKTIALEEVSVVKPGDAAKLTIKYRNVKEASYQIYRVDLMKLYLREKNLSTITKVNLAGIAPLAEATLTLGDGKDYADKEKTVELKVKDEGAYLVICRGDDLFASGLVLITPLKIDIQEDALSGRVRVNVTDPAAKRYVPEVHVKAVGSADGVFRGGETDLRGIFVADNIRGKVTVIARSGDSRYAFHRGQAWLGAPEEAPVPAPAAERQGDTDYNMNLRSQNDAVQRANTIQYQKVRQGKPTGVNLEKLR